MAIKFQPAHVSEYRKLRPTYEVFCTKLKTLLEELLKESGIPFHVVEARAKTTESFEEKAQREGKAYNDPLREITDLAALRVIVYYEDDIDRVAKLIEAEFNVDDKKSEDKRHGLAPDQFGYLSVHKIAGLSSSRADLAEWKAHKGLVAEIQIRTVLQHAWAAINHSLKYKATTKSPPEFTRRFFRLAGLLELADEQFGALRKDQKNLEEYAAREISMGNLNLRVDSVSLAQFSESSALVAEVLKIAIHAGLGDARDDDGGDKGISQLGAVCDLLDIDTVEELEDRLKRAIPLASAFFQEFRRLSTRPTSGSPAHWAAVLLIGTNKPFPAVDKIQAKIGWGDGYAERTLKAGKTADVPEGKRRGPPASG